MRSLVLLVLLVLAIWTIGCGPSHPNPQVIRLENGHAIAVSTTTAADPVKRAQLAAAAEYTIQQWQNYNGCDLNPTLVIVSDTHIQEDGFTANGFWRGGAVVEVWIGDHNEMPALFHEFCHRAFFLYDHSDPRWPAWDIAGNTCYHVIDAGR